MPSVRPLLPPLPSFHPGGGGGGILRDTIGFPSLVSFEYKVQNRLDSCLGSSWITSYDGYISSEDIGMFSSLYQTSNVIQYPSNPCPLYPCIPCTPGPCWGSSCITKRFHLKTLNFHLRIFNLCLKTLIPWCTFAPHAPC